MKYARLVMQSVSLIMQTIFFSESLKLLLMSLMSLYVDGMGTLMWNQMLSTLVIVAFCEIVSFVEAIFFAKTKPSKYSGFYLVCVIVNAAVFMTNAYYSIPGTVLCFISYLFLYALRIRNLICNVTEITK